MLKYFSRHKQSSTLNTFLTVAFLLAMGHRAAAFVGDIDFSEAEKIQHKNSISRLIQVTRSSMEDFNHQHFQSIQACGIGLLAGFKSSYSKLSTPARESWIKSNAKCKNPPSVEDISITSCEMYTNRHLENGFAAVQEMEIHGRIMKFYNDNDRSGIALAYALSKLGWKVVYWNTDAPALHNSPLDRRKMGATPQDHIISYQMAKRNHKYYGVPVDSFMINFAPEAGSGTVQDLTAYNAFMKMPYFIGVAHGGFHVFPGFEGTVSESHSPHNPNLAKNIQVGRFAPPLQSPNGLTTVVDGKAQMSYYYSGIVVLPPVDGLWF